MSRTRSWSWSVGAVWRGVSAAALLGALLVLLLGGALNNIQVKYARFNNQHSNHPASCARGLFIIDIEHSEFCCDKHYHETDWACMAAYDTVNYVFSSFLAWLIPLVPFVCTVAVDVYSHRSSLSALTSSTSTSSSSSVSDKASTQNVAYLFGSHVRRLALYITIFTFRTVVLYYAGGLVEAVLQDEAGTTTSCWYSDLTGGAKCKKNFDYSDHLVLLLTHFITVAALELTYVLHASNLQPMSKYSATILSAVGISLFAYRTLLFTGMFFHTTYENLVGLGLYILLIQLPLWALSGTRLFRSMFI